MKKVMLLPFFFLLLFGTAFGQSNRSTIRFYLKDGGLISLAINGRYFNKTGSVLTVGEIPGKREDIKVYRFYPYRNKRGGKADLLFSGRIKIEKGKKYDAVIDAKTGQLFLTPVSRFGQIAVEPSVAQNNHDVANMVRQEENNDSTSSQGLSAINDTVAQLPKNQLSASMQMLKSQMDKEVTDVKKLSAATDYVFQVKNLSAQDVYNICSWLLFDENRLKFLKDAYPKISDPENLGSVANTFTETASKRAFEQFLKSKGQ